MKMLRFYGFSDDTFGEYGITGEDVDNCVTCKPIQCIIDCGKLGRLMVVGQYAKASMNNGCWMIGVCKVDENDPFPDWKISLGPCAKVDYSTELTIDVPIDDFVLQWFSDGRPVG